MKLLHKPMLKLLFVFFSIFLNSSFVWSMEYDLEEFTHSHRSIFPPDIKALYISENASLHDREGTNEAWSRPIIRPEDDRYLRLLKEAFIAFPGYNNPNHLMVGIEAVFSQSDTKEQRWHYWHLTGREERLRDFCSAPFSDDWRSSIKLEENVTPQDIVINSGTVLRRITLDPTSYHLDKALPILSWIDHKFIQTTFYGYSHSEIEALNALVQINFHSIFDPIIRANNFLQGLVIKFYSYHDICDSCQSAIQCFIPKFQQWINNEFKRGEAIIPVTPIGIVSHGYGFCHYYNKKEDSCNECVIRKIDNLQDYLNNNVKWRDLPQSHYNTVGFSLHDFGKYKPFPGRVRALKQEQDPALHIYIKQPSIEGLESYLKPEYQEFFGIEDRGPGIEDKDPSAEEECRKESQ